MTISISKTKVLVKAALSGQKDWSKVSKYDHCIRVRENMRQLLVNYNKNYDEDALDFHNVALLHDIIEDSDLEADDLRAFGYNERVVSAVTRLTHDEANSYQDYIDMLCRSGDILALMGKLADNIDNTDPKRNIGLTQNKLNYGAKRYGGVRQKLLAAIEELV